MKRIADLAASRRTWAWPYILFLILFVVLPLVLILFYAFTNGEGQFTLYNFVRFFHTSEAVNTLIYSLAIALITTIICLLLGYPAAFIMANAEFKTPQVMALLFILGLDPMTGSPQVSFTFADENQKQNTLKELLDYLESYAQKIVLAIDEFQQIREYEGINMEAILRKHIQHLHNVRFIYCGSKKHTMTDMFTNAKKPFYESTSFCYLSKLPVKVYAAFIREKFESAGKSIDDDSLDHILDWTKVHTYYTQRLCNEVFSLSNSIVDRDIVHKAIQAILDSERERFREIRRLITRAQWKMLCAIAKEDSVTRITSSAFLSKYGITSGPTALRNIKALIDKELILATTEEDGTSYSVYNVFLSRYLVMEQ